MACSRIFLTSPLRGYGAPLPKFNSVEIEDRVGPCRIESRQLGIGYEVSRKAAAWRQCGCTLGPYRQRGIGRVKPIDVSDRQFLNPSALD